MNREDYSLHVLRNGWTKNLEERIFTSGCTISLITGPKNILIDPGSPWDTDRVRGLLRQAANLDLSDINYLICTHDHVDHIGSLHNFVHSCIIFGGQKAHSTSRSNGSPSQQQCIEKIEFPFEIDENIQIISTSGHTKDDISVIFTSSNQRTAIVGDLFECKEDTANVSLWQSASNNVQLQTNHRQLILRSGVDVIVPGHGPSFKVSDLN